MDKKVAIFWDWNGTVVDDAFIFVKIMNFFLEERGLKNISIDDYKKKFEFPVKKYYLNLGFDFKEESFSSLGRRFIDKYTKYQFDGSLFPGIKDLLFDLKNRGFCQFVVSAQENGLLVSSVRHYGLDGCFNRFVGVSNFFAKGKVELAKNLYNNFLSKKYKVFLVGDTLYDIKVAASINATPVLVSFGHNDKKRLLRSGALVIDSVEELSSFLINPCC